MQANWISQQGSDKVLVVFGGWAIGPDPVLHLAGDHDLLFVDDYSNLDCDLTGLEAYTDRVLLAWSFGVAAAAHWVSRRIDPFTAKVAVNGTLNPVDRHEGIPPLIFNRTHKTLNTVNFANFVTRVFNGNHVVPDIDIAAGKLELEAVARRGAAPDMKFDRIWISEQDQIFPPANMNRAWAKQADQIRKLPSAAHAPFDQFRTLEEMLE